MIKECSVVLNNEAVTVVKFDRKDVQLPAIKREAKKVLVNYENGKYSIVNDDAKTEDADKNKKKAGAIKKTTVEETVADENNLKEA